MILVERTRALTKRGAGESRRPLRGDLLYAVSTVSSAERAATWTAVVVVMLVVMRVVVLMRVVR